MKYHFKIFFWGFVISFLGSLPLGTMNVTATNIAVKQGIAPAFVFSAGTLLVEAACVYAVLLFMQWVQQRQRLFRVFEWITTLLILVLAISCFIDAAEMKKFGSNVFTASQLPVFVLGMIISVLNPLHIPFWFGWSTVLISKKILIPVPKYFPSYITGIGIGTMLGFAVFIYGGNYAVQMLNEKQNLLNWFIGIVLLATVIIQVYKMRRKRGVVAFRLEQQELKS